ncbi:DEAD/DEAH box helicase [Chryseobacterium sp.]|uniref:DEAD/DEAH box helicase n=1 Tax=Chryseobacterium sp. TaxID=1871047 RepID=UPI0025B9AEA3|nr:DEAD/DEAH box helicase [Chryseobacterium sp.]
MSFKNLNLINPIIRAATEAGYSKPTEIQYAVIPHVLDGRDIIVAETGLGKTASFTIPILQLLKKYSPEHNEIRTLILTPNKELAQKIEENFEVYSKYLPLSQFSVFEGVLEGSQLAALRKRVDVLIATPVRLLDLVNRRYIDLSKIEIFVLDEADRMLDLEFVNDIQKIMKLIPLKKQTLLFSSSMSPSIKKLAYTLLTNPKEIITNGSSMKKGTSQHPVYFS